MSEASQAPDPVNLVPGEEPKAPEPGIALCLSGGGYRAMLFHAGSLWRLYETGILKETARISSVSGGSIIAGFLGLRWAELSHDPARLDADFIPAVIEPIRALARHTIDIPSVLRGLVTPRQTIGDIIAGHYRRHLFGEATLQDLPDTPRFVINATNVQSGVLWRFMKPYMRDYKVGEVRAPVTPLATAVAASSAFPPFLSPVILTLASTDFSPRQGEPLYRGAFLTRVVLSDGGVYDNLGLETAWKRYDTILVSDAGGQFAPEERPWRNWGMHAYRVLNTIDNQVRSLRKRQLIDAYQANRRQGAYWGIRTDIAKYELPQVLDCPEPRTAALAAIGTRLARLPDATMERLINWGYAVTDAALRRHVNPALPLPAGFPYPKAGV